jgi:hypothetical protein
MEKPALQKPHAYHLAEPAREFLMDLANIPDWPVPFNQAEQAWAMQRRAYHRKHLEILGRRRSALGDCSSTEIVTICRLLRRVWTERSLPRKHWFVFLLRQFHAGIIRYALPTTDESELLVSQHQSARAALDAIFRRSSKQDVTRGVLDFLRQQAIIDTYASEPPRRTFFDDCLVFLIRRLRLLRKCQHKGCEIRPYFIADKPRQKYCSQTCARKVRLARKRDWWAKNRGKDSKKRRK